MESRVLETGYTDEYFNSSKTVCVYIMLGKRKTYNSNQYVSFLMEKCLLISLGIESVHSNSNNL